MQQSKLAQGSVSPESKAKPTWISKRQTEFPRVSLPPGSSRIWRGKTQWSTHSHLWTLERWSGNQRLRALVWVYLEVCSSKRPQHFQRNSHQSGGNRPAPGEWGRGEENPTQKQQTAKEQRAQFQEERVIFSPGKGEVWVKIIFSFRLLESIVLETEKSDPSPPRMWPMHKATHADGRVSQIPKLRLHLCVVHLPALPKPSFPSQISQSSSCLLLSALSISSAKLTVDLCTGINAALPLQYYEDYFSFKKFIFQLQLTFNISLY